MPTLDEIRKWLRGHDVDGLPDREDVWPTPIDPNIKRHNTGLVDKMIAKRERQGKYVVSVDGRDAMIKFGKHNGKVLSQVAEIDRGYLAWIISEDFPAELKDICKYLQRKTKTFRR